MKVYLPDDQYIALYCELAERRLHAFVHAEYIDNVMEEDEDGNEHYSEKAQDIFDEECNIIYAILGDAGIHQATK